MNILATVFIDEQVSWLSDAGNNVAERMLRVMTYVLKQTSELLLNGHCIHGLSQRLYDQRRCAQFSFPVTRGGATGRHRQSYQYDGSGERFERCFGET